MLRQFDFLVDNDTIIFRVMARRKLKSDYLIGEVRFQEDIMLRMNFFGCIKNPINLKIYRIFIIFVLFYRSHWDLSNGAKFIEIR